VAQYLELQNHLLRAVVAPDEGGRIVSLRSLQSGVEFLFQSQNPVTEVLPGRNASFGQGACAGIEECLPTVSKCVVNGEVIPDHGDYWQMAWNVLPTPEADTLHLCATGFSRPLRFTKKILLRGATLRLEYQIENTSGHPTSFHYATHPLLAIEAGDTVLLPEEVSALTLYDSGSERLGRAGQRVGWPVCTPESGATPIDASRILEPSAGTADMLYSDRLQAGWCGLYRAQRQQGIVVRFDPAQLPYLGLWICCGGWPEDDSGPKQYAFAPEPTTAPCGSLQEAVNHGIAVPLLPQGRFEFAVEFCIAPQGLSREAFSSLASEEILK
jgi:galactose mutarotase-like enzyme